MSVVGVCVSAASINFQIKIESEKNTSYEHFFFKYLNYMDDNNMRAGVAVLHITDLPDGILVSISKFLAKPSIVVIGPLTPLTGKTHDRIATPLM